MLVMGIDPGTATTGYGLVSDQPDGSLLSIDYGVILTDPASEPGDRLLVIHQALEALILLHQPDSAGVEKLFFQRNITSAIAVGQARGVVMLTLAKAAIPILEYTPMQVKQAVCGYGGADKRQVQLMVKSLLNLEHIPKPDDAADALAIAICHLHSHRFSTIGLGE
jgi:crossover junction endodeoxyribonuclease RuvC